jgi:hypothetical protein
MLTVLEIAPGEERLRGGHHPHVAHRGDARLPMAVSNTA